MSKKKTDHSLYIHGVFMEIFGLGVFFNGKSGVGKSETALALIDRGHCLIADDSVFLSLNENNRITGKSPELLKDLLEIRGLGILNVRSLFGELVLKNEANVDLLFNFVPTSFEASQMTHPVSPIYSYMTILNQSIPEITLSLLPGRNTALIIEAAVRHHQYQKKNNIEKVNYAI